MTKVDFKKEMKELYKPAARDGFRFVDVPEMQFLAIDGRGNPNTAQSFSDAVEALFGLSYGLKFRIKKSDDPLDYGVMPLEALWWAEDMNAFAVADKDSWLWTAMIMQPARVTPDLVEEVREEKIAKKGTPAFRDVRLITFDEGRAAQCLYTGPYADEAPTIQSLHQFIEDQGLALRGKHHEIYLSDMRRTDPSRLKTIIRQPAGPAE